MRPLILAAPVLLAAGIAHAAGVREDTPTAAQIAACSPDAQRFCLRYLADHAAMRTCMIEHKKQLSETCKAAFAK
ncbi:MAG TPA: hypothetical protein VG291_00885 [Xanthobacteraceae bacterium]|jgi:hypothetical protein|nr:hypothetical protein [Xanthobacteraceae bacterium]